MTHEKRSRSPRPSLPARSDERVEPRGRGPAMVTCKQTLDSTLDPSPPAYEFEDSAGGGGGGSGRTPLV